MDFPLSKIVGVGGRFVFEMRKIFLGDEKRAMLLIPRARVIAQRVIDDMARNSLVQGQAIEEGKDFWIKVTVIAAAGLQRMVTAKMFVPLVISKNVEEVSSNLFFWQNSETGERFVLNLSSGKDWKISTAPGYIEYGTVEDDLALSSSTETWIGKSKSDVLVWDLHQTGIYGTQGTEIVPADVDAERWDGYSGGCLFDGVPVVIEMITGEAWAVRGKDKKDWDSLGIVWTDDYGEFYLDVTFDEQGKNGIAVTKHLTTGVAPIVVRIELSGDADNILMSVTEDDSNYFFENITVPGVPIAIQTTTSRIIWDTGFYHDEERLFDVHSLFVEEFYTGPSGPAAMPYTDDLATAYYGIEISEFNYTIVHTQINDTALGRCVEYDAEGRFVLNGTHWHIASQTATLSFVDRHSCGERHHLEQLLGETIEIWVDNTLGASFPGNVAYIQSIAYTNDMAVALVVRAITYGSPNITDYYFFAYYDGILTELTDQTNPENMINLCSLRGKV